MGNEFTEKLKGASRLVRASILLSLEKKFVVLPPELAVGRQPTSPAKAMILNRKKISNVVSAGLGDCLHLISLASNDTVFICQKLMEFNKERFRSLLLTIRLQLAWYLYQVRRLIDIFGQEDKGL